MCGPTARYPDPRGVWSGQPDEPGLSVGRVWPAHHWEAEVRRGWKPITRFSSESCLGKLLSEVKHRFFYPCVDLFHDINFVLTLENISLSLMFG